MKKILLHILFGIIVVGDLFAITFHNQQLNYIAKPMIMLWIAAYFFLYAKYIDKKVIQLAGFAFVFSWFGDLFMMFAADFLYFVMGIASFLVAQVIYVFLFLRTINLSGKKSFLKKKPVWLIPYMSYGMVLYIALFPELDPILKGAIFIYMVAILSMSAMALNRFGNGHPVSFIFVFTGSLLFVLSDSVIAIDRFLVTVPFNGLVIMSTYIAAQYLIMLGIIKQYE